MTKEQYQILENYKIHLGTAFKANYYRGITSTELKELSSLYEEIFNEPSKLTNGCSHCILADLKRLGGEFFNYQSRIKEELKSTTKTKTIENTKVTKQPPKKTTKNNNKKKNK